MYPGDFYEGIYENFIESSLGKCPGRIVFETFSKKSFVKMSRKTCIFPGRSLGRFLGKC